MNEEINGKKIQFADCTFGASTVLALLTAAAQEANKPSDLPPGTLTNIGEAVAIGCATKNAKGEDIYVRLVVIHMLGMERIGFLTFGDAEKLIKSLEGTLAKPAHTGPTQTLLNILSSIKASLETTLQSTKPN